MRGWAQSAAELQRLKRLRQPQLWRVNGQQVGILPATNFNQFDAASYWRHRGVTKSVKIVSIGQQRTAPSSPLQVVNNWWHRQRTRLIRYCDRLPGALRVYALGLLPGSRAAEAVQELQGMQQLGLLHLFSISGLTRGATADSGRVAVRTPSHPTGALGVGIAPGSSRLLYPSRRW